MNEKHTKKEYYDFNDQIELLEWFVDQLEKLVYQLEKDGKIK